MSSVHKAATAAGQGIFAAATNNPTSPALAQIAAIRTIVGSTSDWRAGMAAKYPQDSRNRRAAELLALLANEQPNVPAELLERIAASRGLGGVTRDVARRVGFSLYPVTPTEFIDAVLRLADQRMSEVERADSKAGGVR